MPVPGTLAAMEKALKEIQRVTGYAMEGPPEMFALVTWINQCASAALRGEFLAEPPRSGTFGPGTVIVKAAPFPPPRK